MNKTDKQNYSVDKTLSNLDEWYTMKLENDIKMLCKNDDTFLKWDIVTIDKIKFKDNETIKVKLSIKRDWKIINKVKLSWWIFLQNFILYINQDDIFENEKKEVKTKTDKIIKK